MIVDCFKVFLNNSLKEINFVFVFFQLYHKFALFHKNYDRLFDLFIVCN